MSEWDTRYLGIELTKKPLTALSSHEESRHDYYAQPQDMASYKDRYDEVHNVGRRGNGGRSARGRDGVAHLWVFRVVHLTEVTLESFIRRQGIGVLDVREVSQREAAYRSFKVTVHEKDAPTLLHKTFWPGLVSCRYWHEQSEFSKSGALSRRSSAKGSREPQPNKDAWWEKDNPRKINDTNKENDNRKGAKPEDRDRKQISRKRTARVVSSKKKPNSSITRRREEAAGRRDRNSRRNSAVVNEVGAKRDRFAKEDTKEKLKDFEEGFKNWKNDKSEKNLSDTGRNRGKKLNDTTRSRDMKLSDTTRSRDSKLNDTTRSRNSNMGDTTKSRDSRLNDTTRSRNSKLSDTTRGRDSKLNDTTRSRNSNLGDTTKSRNSKLSDTTRSRDSKLNDTTRSRDSKLNDTTRSRNSRLSDTTRSQFLNPDHDNRANGPKSGREKSSKNLKYTDGNRNVKSSKRKVASDETFHKPKSSRIKQRSSPDKPRAEKSIEPGRQPRDYSSRPAERQSNQLSVPEEKRQIGAKDRSARHRHTKEGRDLESGSQWQNDKSSNRLGSSLLPEIQQTPRSTPRERPKQVGKRYTSALPNIHRGKDLSISGKGYPNWIMPLSGLLIASSEDAVYALLGPDFDGLLAQDVISDDELFLGVKVLSHASRAKDSEEDLSDLVIKIWQPHVISLIKTFTVTVERLYPERAESYFWDLAEFLDLYVSRNITINEMSSLINTCLMEVLALSYKSFISDDIVKVFRVMQGKVGKARNH